MNAAVGKDGIRLLPKLPLVWILLGICLFFFFGCSHHPVLSHEVGPGRKVYSSASPADLSEYIRTVLKISQEDTQNAQALKKLHEQRPPLEELLKHIAESPEDVGSRRTLAGHYLKEGLYYSAFELYEQIRSTGFEDATAERGLARIWDEWGHYSLAKQHAERALALDPQSAEALELLGKIHLHRNEPQAALSAFLEALARTPENPSLHSTIGSVLLKLGNSGEAREYLEEAVALDPALIEARNNLAEALARLGDDDGALHEFAVANPPAAAFNKLGLVYLADRKWEKAQNAFKQALVQDSDHLKARLNLSVAQSYLPHPTIINLPPLEVARSAQQAYGIERNPASPNPQPVLSAASPHLPTTTMVYLSPFEESTPTPYRPDLDPISIDKAEKELLDDYKVLLAGPTFERTFVPAFPLDDTGAPPHLPTTTIVHLPALEESTPTPYRPDLDPTSIDQEEQGVLALKPTLEDLPISGLPISSQLSPTLDNTTVLTLSQPDTVVGEQKEKIDELLDDHKTLLAGPLFERPRTALATPAQISSLGRSPYLDSAVFLLNPTATGGDGQIGAKVLLSSMNPFGLGNFDIRDFMASFRERDHQQEASWESLSLLGPRDSLNDPFEVGLSGIGLGVVLFLMLGWPIGAIIGGLMRNRT